MFTEPNTVGFPRTLIGCMGWLLSLDTSSPSVPHSGLPLLSWLLPTLYLPGPTLGTHTHSMLSPHAPSPSECHPNETPLCTPDGIECVLHLACALMDVHCQTGDTGPYALVSWTHEPLSCYLPLHSLVSVSKNGIVRVSDIGSSVNCRYLSTGVDVPKETFSHRLLDDNKRIIHVAPPNPGRYTCERHHSLPLKRSNLCETGGSGTKQEWWIVLCLIPPVGQTPWGQSCTSQQTWRWPWIRPKLVILRSRHSPVQSKIRNFIY